MKINKSLKNITFKEYCSINDYKYSVIQNEYIQKVYVPRYVDNLGAKNYITVKYPEIYVAEILNANLLGKNSIVFDDKGYCIYDKPCRDIENKFDLKHANTVYIDRNTTKIVFDDNKPQIIDEGIMLITNAPSNYYHINLEVFSKLCLINELQVYRDIPILIDDIVLKIPQFKKELDMLNKSKRKIIYLKKGSYYKVKKLVCLSDLAIIPLNRRVGYLCKYGDVAISNVAIKLLNSNLAIKNDIFRKIFISRKYCNNKRLENYERVEQIFMNFGYEIIHPEKMSFKDQLKVFSEAEYIAGASGAGLTNILFANKDAKFICILPKEVETTCYSAIPGILGQEYYFLDAKLSGTKTQYAYYQNSFKADERNIYRFLKNIHILKNIHKD